MALLLIVDELCGVWEKGVEMELSFSVAGTFGSGVD